MVKIAHLQDLAANRSNVMKICLFSANRLTQIDLRESPQCALRIAGSSELPNTTWLQFCLVCGHKMCYACSIAIWLASDLQLIRSHPKLVFAVQLLCNWLSQGDFTTDLLASLGVFSPWWTFGVGFVTDIGRMKNEMCLRRKEKLLYYMEEQILALRSRFAKQSKSSSQGAMNNDKSMVWWFCRKHCYFKPWESDT